MGGRTERNWAEPAADAAAAALFAAAVAYAHWTFGQAGPLTAAVAVAGFLLVRMALAQVPAGERHHALPAFEPLPIEPIQAIDGDTDAELLLHDELTAVDPGARVVQLFGPNRAGVPRAVEPRGHRADLPDASRALIDALCELRRSFQ